MKPSRIIEVLDLAWQARQKGQIFNPNFVGGAGLGKSAVCRQWVKMMREKVDPNFGFIDLRGSYMEAPDMIGIVEITTDAEGKKRTSHCLPDFWPTSGNGLLLIEEPNRATTGVMNTFMQMLQEREVGPHYKLPEGWLIAACINPDDPSYDVSAMDAALKNRFVEFEVEYDHNTFCEYMSRNNWDESIQAFVKSGAWVYKEANSLGKDGKYISPRTWEQVNAAQIAGAMEDKQLHRTILASILGKDLGNELWRFIHDDAPVTAADLLKNKAKALKKLREQSKPEAYQGDKISVTIESIVKNYGGEKATKEQIDEETMVEVAKIVSSDQAVVLLKEIGLKAYSSDVKGFFTRFSTKYPELLHILKSNIKLAAK